MPPRRAFLAMLPALVVAGCTGGDEEGTPTPTASPTPTPTPPPTPTQVDSLPHAFIDGELTEDWSTEFTLGGRAWLTLEVHAIEPPDAEVLFLASISDVGGDRYGEGAGTFRELAPGTHEVGLNLAGGGVDAATVTVAAHDYVEFHPVTVVVDEDWGEFVDAWELPTTLLEAATIDDEHRLSVRTDAPAALVVAVEEGAAAAATVDLRRQHPDPTVLRAEAWLPPGDEAAYALESGIHAVILDTDGGAVPTTVTAELRPPPD